ncbi:Uncharacterized protein MLTONO_0512 [Mesorhizobium loti]|nr:Uncharacterized protein MLTONO_0512 [Mesorhizobium loti]
MADPTGGALSGNLSNIVNIVGAAGGLGTAAMGLVDASKAFWGGPSNFGFGYISGALDPFLVQLTSNPPGFNKTQILRTLRANWLNGVAKADQKAKAKSLIHLGLTTGNATGLANAAGVNAAKLQSLAQKTADGADVSQDEINVLGQFDAVLSAALDAAYERGDQKYRNAAKFLSMAIATVLAGVGGWIVFGANYTTTNIALSLLVGVGAAPLAPVAKDLASSLQAAVSAVGTLKG